MKAKLEAFRIVSEDHAQHIIATAERAYRDCWSKLLLLQSPETSEADKFQAFISFQPILLKALFQLETYYNEVRECERIWVSKKKHINRKLFAEEAEKIEHFKALLDRVIDIGKTLGDAFAWIFYQSKYQLLKKHYQHEFIARVPTRLGGEGEVQFITNHQIFGKCFVLAHSITTFLREGDISLVDPKTLEIVAVGELKTQRTNETEASIVIMFPRGTSVPQGLLPTPTSAASSTEGSQRVLDPKFEARRKEHFKRIIKQLERIEDLFRPAAPNSPALELKMSCDVPKLRDAFHKASESEWSTIKVGDGLLLIGIKLAQRPLASLVAKKSDDRDAAYERNLERISVAARTIVDQRLPDNSIITDWMLFRPKARYELGLKMRPLFWWPLDVEVREALTFNRFAVMTMYNPAFLIAELRRMGLEVEATKEGRIGISKKYGEGRVNFRGMQYMVEMIQTYLLGERTVTALIRSGVEGVERANVKTRTYVDLDFNFLFQ